APTQATPPAKSEQPEEPIPNNPASQLVKDAETGRFKIREENVPSGTEGPTSTPGGQVAPPPQPLDLSLAPDKLTVAGPGGFAFNIRVKDAANLQTISLTIKYDPAVTEFDRGLEGVLMRADGTSTTFSATKIGKGTLKVDLSRQGSKTGATGSGPIASLRFNPVGAGRTMIAIVEAVARTAEGVSIPVNTAGADVTVSK
ncbi:MAG TPA: cohesin domain-containing protein, partial [Candidatus Saccharimonadales bacterium]|nr:cohesin domain-containing protein [Candidatus Saccharimonadales bacterium]